MKFFWECVEKISTGEMAIRGEPQIKVLMKPLKEEFNSFSGFLFRERKLILLDKM